MPPKPKTRPAIPTADEMQTHRAQYGGHAEWLHAVGRNERAAWMALNDIVAVAEGCELNADEQREWDAVEAKLAGLTELRMNETVDRSQIINGTGAGVGPDGVSWGSGTGWPGNANAPTDGFRNGPFEGIPGVTNDGVLSPWAAGALTGMRTAMGETETRGRDGGGFQLVKRSGSMHVAAPLLPARRDRSAEHREAGDTLPEPQRVPIAGPMDGRQPTYPTRLVELLVNRKPLTETNEFSWAVQTLRENKAATVPDRVEKPVSRYRMEERTDHCRVIAHLSEPAPLRFFDDVTELGRFLQSEMELGLLDAIEWNIISGDGVSDATTDNMLGLVNAEDTHTQAWDNDLPRTLRRARTTMKIAGEQPTAWVLHPEQTEAIDLLREGADGAFLNGQFSSNILGALPVVESISVDPEVAVLADWRYLQLIVRDDARLDVDMGGELFRTNQAQLRLEGRYGMALLRTTAFNLVNVSGSGTAPRKTAKPATAKS